MVCTRASSFDEIYAEQFELAQSLFEQGNYVESQELCEKLYFTQPENSKLVLLLILYGRSLLKLNRSAEALFKFQLAIELEPKSDEAWEGMGTSFAIEKEFHSAIECYDKALKINNSSMKALRNLGMAHYTLEQFDKSLIILNTAIQMHPILKSEPITMHYMGLVHLNHLHDAAAAEPFFKFCVDLDNKDEIYDLSLVSLFNIYYELNKLDLAFLTAIQMSENYILKNIYNKAIAALQIAIILSPNNYYAHWKLGRLFNKMQCDGMLN